MPIFEYECGSCGDRFEQLVMRRSDPDPSCPTCDAETVNKLISSTSFRLKGTGWYATDYSGGSGKGQSGSDKDKGSDDAKASSEAKSSESKASPSSEKKSKSPGDSAAVA